MFWLLGTAISSCMAAENAGSKVDGWRASFDDFIKEMLQ
jgi:hypothetical protein